MTVGLCKEAQGAPPLDPVVTNRDTMKGPKKQLVIERINNMRSLAKLQVLVLLVAFGYTLLPVCAGAPPTDTHSVNKANSSRTARR